MKRNITFKALVCLLTVAFVFQASPYIFAHPTSQEGILVESYVGTEDHGGYYIGGENVGWAVDEDFHTNGTTVTYSFSTTDPYLSDAYKNHVIEGAARWSSLVTIINKTDGSGMGTITTYDNPNSIRIAGMIVFSADNSGHLTSWMIEMNRSKIVTSTTLAHEFGHAIGLVDLHDEINSNKLMYGYSDRTSSTPTNRDLWGAKLITGVHTTHTWGYKYHSTANGNNRHVKYCTECNGLTDTVSACVYNANNICIQCRIPRGIQPY